MLAGVYPGGASQAAVLEFATAPEGAVGVEGHVHALSQRQHTIPYTGGGRHDPLNLRRVRRESGFAGYDLECKNK